uniref:Uncharacterized protein n=1 Tax=Anguilla anguilla TaxID=7936 RepID=A0A0E9PRS1_ANGAN
MQLNLSGDQSANIKQYLNVIIGLEKSFESKVVWFINSV